MPSTCAVPIVHKAGDVARRDARHRRIGGRTPARRPPCCSRPTSSTTATTESTCVGARPPGQSPAVTPRRPSPGRPAFIDVDVPCRSHRRTPPQVPSMPADAARLGRAGRDRRDRPDRLSHRRRPVRDAGDPAVAGAGLWRHAGRHGPRRQRQHVRHGGGRPARRAASAAASTAGAASSSASPLLAIPTALLAVAPDLATFTALRVAQGALHGRGLHADARLSRRAMQRRRRRRRASPPTSPAMSRATCSAA